jgi:hypothetical protein
VLVGHPQQINAGFSKIFCTGNFMSACRRWNEKDTADKNWSNFKVHLNAAHRQHKQIQGGSASNSGYHEVNAAVGQTEYQMAEATIGALTNLVTATATDRGVVTTLTEANSRLAKQLEDRSNELEYIKALLKKERAEIKGQISSNPSPYNYCWTHEYKVDNSHAIPSCKYPKHVHKREASKADNMGGSQANIE